MLSILVASIVVLACPGTVPGEGGTSVSDARRDKNGWLVHDVQSPFQAGTTRIRVLLPDHLDLGRKYPAIYLLPVEAGDEHHYGDGLLEAQRRGLHNTHRVLLVAPTFSHLPWYADHPTDRAIRQESYFMNVVVPFIERTYPAAPAAERRLLLGFSKSGWGAWSLLLRHPQQFGRAVAWDAPLMMDQPGKYGSGAIFGTAENFERYRLTSALRTAAAGLASESRLLLIGYRGFRQEHQAMHALLGELHIPHVYRDGPDRPHEWQSGWLPEAVELLLAVPQPK